VLVIVAVLMLLASLILPKLASRGDYALGFSCLNNLKQIGLAFRIWQGDNNEKFPMSVSVTNGGTMELVGSGTVWRHFQVMSNEISTPKILLCPNDVERQKNLAVIWGSSSEIPPYVGFAGNTNTSYFVGVDAMDANPTMFLAGDRNLTVKNVALKPGLHSLSTNELMGWTKEMHVNYGNVLLADASVQQFNAIDLRKALENTGVTTNRLAVP
jgi:hypothetical protein